MKKYLMLIMSFLLLGIAYLVVTRAQSVPAGPVAKVDDGKKISTDGGSRPTGSDISDKKPMPVAKIEHGAPVASNPLKDALLIQERLSKPRAALITAGKVSSEFARLFELSAQQVAALNEANQQAKREVDKLILANSSVKTEGDGKVTIETSIFDGAQVYDNLLNSYEAQLGKQRLSDFLKLGAVQLESSFDNFGAQIQKLTVERITTPDSQNSYKVTIAQKNGGWGKNGAAVMSKGEFDANYGRYIKILPPEFQ